CIRVCPSDAIEIIDEKARITGEISQGCGHCMAVCPEGAAAVGSIDETQWEFATFKSSKSWMKPGQFDISSLFSLMASRRSCRNFTDRHVDLDILNDLVKMGTTAPSGTNSQMWGFTIVPDRDKVLELGGRIARFYNRMNRLSESFMLRKILRLAGKPELDHYHKEYHDRVKAALEEMEENGRDRLFHGAPAVILAGSDKAASCPVEDALLATQNILLSAHAMGLGSCLIGFAVEAIQRDASIRKATGFRDDEIVCAAIALGYPDESYLRVTGRKPVAPRIL
ncbi:MAG: nitroreductase family protein, partial [Thermodesulfobacteriota bacterium]